MRTVALVVAILLGVAAAIGVRSYMVRQQRETQQKYSPVPVATARRSIEAGEKLDPDMFEFTLNKPANTLTTQDITRDQIDAYVGRELRRPADRGKQIFAGYFIEREERGGSRILAEGMVAITIGVDSTSGVAGLVRPGDHVDIYATTIRSDVPETLLVLSDVTVMAVDDRVNEVPAGLPGYTRGRAGYSSLTLMVTPKNAELLVYLKSTARLTFALRSLQDIGKPLTGMPVITEQNWRGLLGSDKRAPAPASP